MAKKICFVWLTLVILLLAFLQTDGRVSAETNTPEPPRGSNATDSYSFTQWTTITNDPAHPTQIFSGDFNGDGLDDLLTYVPDGIGAVHVSLNNGSGFDAPTLWTVLEPLDQYHITIGEFTNDGLVDIVAYREIDGDIWVGTSSGSDFSFDALPWATASPISGWQFYGADFTGDGFGDIAGYNSADGSIWMGRNDTGTFQFGAAPWTTVAPAAGWNFVSGHFDADGQPDLSGYYPNGTVWQLLNQGGTSFTTSQMATVSPASGWTFASGQFVSGGRSELLTTRDDGNLLIGQYSTLCGASYAFSRQGSVTPATGWVYRAGQFSGDGRSDVLVWYPPTGGVWVAPTGDFTLPLEGYAWPQSAEPGQAISFYLNGNSSGVLEIVRNSADAAGVHSSIVATYSYTPINQPTNDNPERYGAGWGVSHTQIIPTTWQSGYYSARAYDLNGNPIYIPFVVKPSPANRAEVAMLANTNTWLAYNNWGCGGKYGGKANVSFLRPDPGASPFGDAHLTRGELWTQTWLSNKGLAPDMFSDLDLHNNGLPGSYKVLILTTHPEYWTSQMMNNLRTFLNNGGTLLYLGGNGLFERGSYYGDQTGMVFREGVEGGLREDALFRRLPMPDPERNILGVATAACRYSSAPYAVRPGMAGHFLFDGTGLTDGGEFGNSGLSDHGGMASGWEMDTTSGTGALGIPIGCDMNEALSVPTYPALPAGLVILAKGTNATGDGAEMTYYTHNGGGVVFSVGSVNFGGSLAVDAVIQQIVCNVLKQAGVVCGVPTAVGLAHHIDTVKPTPQVAGLLLCIAGLLSLVLWRRWSSI